MRLGNGRTTGLLALLLLASASAYAVTPTLDAANPYSVIVQRNGFGLKEPPPVNVVKPPEVEPIKIKILGISTILGRKQVLLKVLARPPMRPKEEALILNEREERDGIEVVSIDEVKELVRFKLAGSLVTLSMKDDSEKPVAGPAPASSVSPVPQPSHVPQPGMG